MAAEDRAIEQFLDRIVDAKSSSVINAYEKRIQKLEMDKVLFSEKIEKCGRPIRDFDATVRTALNFLASPCIRSQLLGKQETFPRRRIKRPVKDQEALGQVLGELGKARLANNLNQLAKAVNTGSLPVTLDTEKTIQDACIGVQDMRSLLMIALDFPNHIPR